VSKGARDALNLAPRALFAAGSSYYYVSGVHFGERATSRPAALAFPVFFVAAVVSFARLFLL
jgi:hypothetical protein